MTVLQLKHNYQYFVFEIQMWTQDLFELFLFYKISVLSKKTKQNKQNVYIYYISVV